MALPGTDDVVIRQKHGNPSTVYLLGIPSAPDQFVLRTRDEAISQALAYAKHQRVRAWLANNDDDFVQLGTFRAEDVESARSS